MWSIDVNRDISQWRQESQDKNCSITNQGKASWTPNEIEEELTKSLKSAINAKDVLKSVVLHSVGGIVNYQSHYAEWYGGISEIKIRTTSPFNNPTPGHVPKEMTSLC